MAPFDDPEGIRLLRNLRAVAGVVVLALVAIVVVGELVGAEVDVSTLGILIGALLTLLGLVAIPNRKNGT